MQYQRKSKGARPGFTGDQPSCKKRNVLHVCFYTVIVCALNYIAHNMPLVPTTLFLMASESSAWLHFVWSCSWRVWSCRSWSWSSLSITALSAFASVSSERRSNSWAYKGAVHKREADEGIQRQIHMLGQTPHCTCFHGVQSKKRSPIKKKGSVSPQSK